jgi:hypothetical protein
MPLQFECRKVALKQDRTGFVLTLALHPDEIPEELLRDFVGSRYACVMVRLQDDESPTEYVNRVQQAGMLCRLPEFQQFMTESYGSNKKPLTEDQTADLLCSLCDIESRTELNGNVNAKQLFDDLMSEYKEWKLNATPF